MNIGEKFDKWRTQHKGSLDSMFDAYAAGHCAGAQHRHDEVHALAEQNRVMREALEEAKDGMATMVDDLAMCFDGSCVPTKEEVASAEAYLKEVREFLAACASPGGSKPKEGEQCK
jgi:hypothetical protein